MTLIEPDAAPAATGPYPVQRLKLIFNPFSGSVASSPAQLLAIVTALQAANYLPEVFLVQPDCDLHEVVKDALRRGLRLFVVCGGDGTIDSVAGALAGTRGTLGIVPAGTRNNVAFSLGIPDNSAAAVGLLRGGRRLKIDVGLAATDQEQRVFLEACSVGLLSALFPATDDLQHGNLARIGDLLGTLISTQLSEMHLQVDNRAVLHTQGHIVVAANMLFIGPHFRVDANSTLDDGLLDLVVYAELSKLDLLGTVISAATGGAEDVRIRHDRVRRVVVETNPPMPVILDGFPMTVSGPLRLSVRRRALNVIAAPEAPAAARGQAQEPNPDAKQAAA
jgi:diacylglycerol kinase (ATP)